MRLKKEHSNADDQPEPLLSKTKAKFTDFYVYYEFTGK